MALSKENQPDSSQLKGLIDLLIDLQIVNALQESSNETPPAASVKVEGAEDSLTKNDESEVNSLTEVEENVTLPTEDDLEKQGDRLSFESAEISPEKLNLPLPNPPDTTQEVKSQASREGEEIKAEENRQEQLEQSREQQEEQEFNHPPLLPEVELKRPENVDTAPEQVFNRLIQSQWHSQQNLLTSQPLTAKDDKAIENSIELFERWQRLMLTQQMMDSRETVAKFKTQLETLEQQVYEPEKIINLLVPLISEILTRKVVEAREEAAQALAPIVDEMILNRTQQDKNAMSSALAPVLPDAITLQVINSPGEFAKALGPEMGTAIKEQIYLERDAMVDALYPVIGSTVSKYFAEAIRTINAKVETTFSLEGISRKIRAKIQGVSEAELIFTEAMPFTVQAIFLIQKTSGLVIAEVQPSGRQQLESEMVAGMLTAIRSFVNDCIVQSGEISEIDQIDYGNSKIILEVAGYCYLAVVTQGEPPTLFKQKLRATLSTIVQTYGKPVELFDGDPSKVPEPINPLLQNLTKAEEKSSEYKRPITPIGLMLVSLGVLGAIFVPLGIHQHLSTIERHQEEETSLALASDPDLAIYRLGVDVSQGTMKLSGRLPNQYLRSKAEQIAKKVEPKLKINNAIIPVEVPPDLVLAQGEVKRVTNLLNQMDGAVISTDFSDGKVTVQGTVLQEADAKKVTQSFKEIPGVVSVTNTVQLQPLAIASRVYFDQGSSEIKPTEVSKISQIKAFLDQYPTKNLKLVGHTDPKGTAAENQPLALERATKIKDILVTQGVDSKRLQVAGTIDPPIGIKAEQVPLLSRCVEFQMIAP